MELGSADIIYLIIIFLVFMAGASAGSFINAVASRTVTERKWWGGERSVCEACGETLRAADLVPVFSYIFLRGRCRYCGAKIGVRCLATELIAGALAAGLFVKWGATSAFSLACIVASFSLFNALTDIENGYIYDLWALAPGVIGIAFRLCDGFAPAIDGLLGAALGAGVIALIILLSRGGMGWGDAFLMAGIGGAVGWRLAAVSLYVGFLAGGAVMLPLLLAGKVKRRDAIPLGPFLAFGAAVSVCAGDILWSLAAQWLGPEMGWPW